MDLARRDPKTVAMQLLWLCVTTALLTAFLPVQRSAQAAGTEPIQVTGFLPDGYVTDGSASYQTQIQKAIDSAAVKTVSEPVSKVDVM